MDTMDPTSNYKSYCHHLKDPKVLYEQFLSAKVDKSTLNASALNPAKTLHSLCVAGTIGGETLIDIGIGPNTGPLLAICDSFKDIIVLKPNAATALEMKKWWQKEPSHYDLSHKTKHICDIKGISEESRDLEEELRTVIKQVLPCNFSKENIADPVVLPKADCVLSVWGLPQISKDEASYVSNIGKMGSLLKRDGRLVLFTGLQETFIIIGDQKFDCLPVTESLLRKALQDAGLRIQTFEVRESDMPRNLVDAKQLVCVVAVKESDN